MWDKGWDDLFSKNPWGKYPDVEVVRFYSRNFKMDREQKKSIKILELGCGPGANLFYFAREGFDIHGIDGSAVAVDRAKKRLNRENLSAKFMVKDVLCLPYEDNFFDSVLDCECTYANSKKDSFRIIKEVYRVLKPGGSFFSMTFATGTYGDKNGKALEDEPNTYTKIHKGALHSEYGIIRFTDFEEIDGLYGQYFDIESVEYLTRSMDNQRHMVKEWLITARK